MNQGTLFSLAFSAAAAARPWAMTQDAGDPLALAHRRGTTDLRSAVADLGFATYEPWWKQEVEPGQLTLQGAFRAWRGKKSLKFLHRFIVRTTDRGASVLSEVHIAASQPGQAVPLGQSTAEYVLPAGGCLDPDTLFPPARLQHIAGVLA